MPAGIPAPHSLVAVPALEQVVLPFGTTCQPWVFSSETAAAGLNGYGGVTAFAGVYGVGGEDGDRP